MKKIIKSQKRSKKLAKIINEVEDVEKEFERGN